MEQLPHVAGVVLNPELLLNHPSNPSFVLIAPLPPEVRNSYRRTLTDWRGITAMACIITAMLLWDKTAPQTAPQAGFALRARWRFAPLIGPLLIRRGGNLSLRP